MKQPLHSDSMNFFRVTLVAIGLAMPQALLAATVSLATTPLATSTTSTVQPNVVLLLDNSGSMGWDHMPDDAGDGGSSVTFRFGYYGARTNQCNQIYYDPTYTYQVPVDASGIDFANASFTAAYVDGFNTGSGTVNLNTEFRASRDLNGDPSPGGPAYYYNYSGTQTTQQQKDYNSTTNTFYTECNSAQDRSPGRDVFTKVSLSSTAAATTAGLEVVNLVSGGAVSSIKLDGTEEIMSGSTGLMLTNILLAQAIATKINACTTAQTGNCTTPGGHHYTATVPLLGNTVTITGLADTVKTITITRSGDINMAIRPTIYPKANSTDLTNFANWYSYYRTRLLMMKTATGRSFSALNNKYRVGLFKFSNSSSPVVSMGTFSGTQRSAWYDALYSISASSSTPSRTALSNVGKYYAHKLGGESPVADPVQYSCQQNFTILSSDGYWNTGDGSKLDGSLMDNQDGTAPRPYYDGAHLVDIWTNTYTRIVYSRVRDGCSGRDRKVQEQPQTGSCVVYVAGDSCYPSNWSNSGPATITGTCRRNPPLPNPNPSAPVLQSSVASQGSSGGSSNSLSDAAMYYYQTDLRTSALGNCTGALGNDVCENNVFTSTMDSNTQQHMTTFTLGLGASGWMKYSSSYLSDSSGDYLSVKLGSTADSTAVPPICSWQADGTVCDWPLPGISGGNGFIANIDDLWHAAVDGRGAYFSATNPATLASGLAGALSGIAARKGSSAAAATSTLNPTNGNNSAYVASYTSVKWTGNLEARGIDINTGVVNENASWCVQDLAAGSCALPSYPQPDTSGYANAMYCVTPGAVICPGGQLHGSECWVPLATACTGTMNAKVSGSSDTRNIYTANSTGNALTPFDTTYRAANSSYFDAAHIGTLSQWSTLTAAEKTLAAGDNLLYFLRGQNGYEDRTANTYKLYRMREAVLGDALESQPAFIAGPTFSYPYPGYADFKAAQATRAGTVYMGANDGMLHAFNADTGEERWAYIPSMVIPNMWKLADKDYANLHVNFVNGSPVISDVCTADCGLASATWKTILIGGLNGGGRGYYALDITNPASPSLLWELTTTGGIGKVKDDDIGYGFAQPVIARKADGTWVVLVTSGYNNVSPGNGVGYLYVLDASTGTILSKISTGVGDTITPSGLARFAVWNDDAGTGNPGTGNKAGYAYGGDLLGNVWRFDINDTATAATIGTGSVLRFATLFSDSAGLEPQPVTTAPVLGKIAGKNIVFVGTGKYLETSDLTDTQLQSLYAIKDDNTGATLANPRTSATMVQQTITTLGESRTVSNNTVNFGTHRGWFVDFPDSGERVNLESKLVLGTLLVPTIVPSTTACTPGGYGWLNFFNYQSGGAIDTLTNLSGYKYEAPIVGVNIVYIGGKPVIEVVTSVNPTPTVEERISINPALGVFTGERVLWRELHQ